MEEDKNGAPPQILVLLWHHFCWYKRHWIKLVATILLPFVYMFGLFGMIHLMTNSPLGKMVKYPEDMDSPRTMSFPSAGPLASMIEQYIIWLNEPYRYQLIKTKREPFFRYPIKPEPNAYDRSPLDAFLRYGKRGYKPDSDSASTVNSYLDSDHTASNENHNFKSHELHHGNGSDDKSKVESTPIPKPRLNSHYEPMVCSHCFSPADEDQVCAMLRRTIFYYPSNSSNAKMIMDLVADQMETFVQFYSNFPSNARGKARSLRNMANRYKSCIISAKDRVMGFKTHEDLLAYMNKKWNTDERSDRNSFAVSIWAAIKFDASSFTMKNQVRKYRIMVDSSTLGKENDIRLLNRVHWLRDLVDDAIVQLTTGRPPSHATAYKETSIKCTYVPGQGAYYFLYLILPFVVVFSFSMPPANFLEQVLVEKRLKLREYLYIMGVGRFQLKMSWILFYLLWLVPLAMISSIILHLLPGPMLGRTSITLFIVLLIVFNISQLSFCYMLAAFLKTEKRSSIIFYFMTIFFLMLSPILDNTTKGPILALARIASLHNVPPMTKAVSYIVKWEELWIGGLWDNFFKTPLNEDGYGGFGEAILWLLGDTLLYLVVAWYVEHVNPGDYGVKQPFYFPFMPSFWCPSLFPKSYTISNVSAPEKADVEPAPGLESGVELINLTKYYSADRVGVNQLTLNFHRNEVTAFLGENGAGKSTTLNTLVGLISATGGNAKVLGMDTHDQIEEVRKNVGFVPQYDILYPSMTVEEHIQFFGWLKGLSKSSIQDISNAYLEQFGLLHTTKIITTELSGGQKRKLSILTVFLGNPQVIILDEPTSGVDPLSRRAIWDMILSRRREATVILSTHFMQEADILGDRVAIISQGELKCSGTPMYLKNKYGHGYRLIVACNPRSANKEAIKEFMLRSVPDSYMKEEKGFDVTFSIPIEFARSDKMVGFLEKLEEEKIRLSIVSYGLSEPTLEEIFFAATDARNMSISHPGNQDGPQMGELQNEIRPHVTSDQISRVKKGSVGMQLFHQAIALMLKKLLYTAFSWWGYILQIFLPLAFVILLLLAGEKKDPTTSRVADMDLYRTYRSNKILFSAPTTDLNPYIEAAVKYGLNTQCFRRKCQHVSTVTESLLQDGPSIEIPTSCDCKVDATTTDYCTKNEALDQPHQTASDGNTVYRLGSSINSIENWIKFVNESSAVSMGGFESLSLDRRQFNELRAEFNNYSFSQLIQRTTNVSYVVAWHEHVNKLAILNAWANLLVRSAVPESGIEVEYEVLSLVKDPRSSSQSVDFGLALFNSMFLDFAFAFGTIGIVVFIQYENASGLKRLQLISGANPLIYWTVSLIVDFFFFLITLNVILLFLGVFDNAFKAYIDQIALAIIPYGLSSIAFTYLLSFASRKSKGIVIFTVISATLFFASALIIVHLVFQDMISQKYIERDPKSYAKRYKWAEPLSAVLRIFPNFYLAEILLVIILPDTYTTLNIISSQSGRGEGVQLFDDPFSFNMLGKRILTEMIAFVVYFAAVCLLEYFDVQNNLGKICQTKTASATNPFQSVDEDVRREEERVNRFGSNDPLQVKNLSKTYKGSTIPAVVGVTFGVPKSECFGLLGINGAGKSTLFRMLTGFEKPTSGTAVLEGVDLHQSSGWSARRNFSYCPQENTLFEKLSVKHHLKLFATLRGIPAHHVTQLINALIREVGLEPHVSKKAGQLSGGNQRKLQFAIALLDYCPVVFLDEPTTGMDPGARRMAWNCVKRAIAQGCSVVLTSHSMEECEELCHRLVLMVAGAFQCIGSVQYLKDKFGNKYTFKLKIHNDPSVTGGEPPLEAIKTFVFSKYPEVTLLEEHTTMMSFEIPAEGIRLSQLFALLTECRNKYPVEDFTVSQTTLEHVFVNMARLQEMLQSGLLPPSTSDQQLPDAQSGHLQPQGAPIPSLQPPVGPVANHQPRFDTYTEELLENQGVVPFPNDAMSNAHVPQEDVVPIPQSVSYHTPQNPIPPQYAVMGSDGPMDSTHSSEPGMIMDPNKAVSMEPGHGS